MKLKTLKDFRRKDYSEEVEEDGTIIKYFDERVLKQEAIKWVKDRISKCEDCNLMNIENYKPFPIICEEHAFWIVRFNITGEDLI